MWGVSIFLTIWNSQGADEIIHLKNTHALLLKHKQFVGENSEAINKALQNQEAFFQSIDSPQFGFLSVETLFRQLSDRYRLKELRTDYKRDIASESATGDVPIRLTFHGSAPDAIACLNRIETGYPYLAVSSVTAIFDADQGMVRFEVDLIYKFRITTDKNLI